MSHVTSTRTLAIDGGTPVRNKPWPVWPPHSEQRWTEQIEPALREVYMSGVEGLPGPRAAAFAQAWAEFHDSSYGVMTPHGTDALMAAIAAAVDHDGLTEPGEVIMPAYTFIATASAALALRCKVAFADIDPVTYTLDPAAVEAMIGPETVAIMPVHIGGHPAAMDEFVALGERHGLVVIEDCAQAHGASWRGRRVGSWGDAGGYSFQSSKNVTSGEGGCVVTNEYTLYERVCSFVDVGRRPGGERWEYPRLGWNYRPSEYLAALLSARLADYPTDLVCRSAAAAYLTEQLADVPGFTPPAEAEGCTQHGYHLYMMRVDPSALGGRGRGEVIAALGAEGIPGFAGYGASLDQHEALIAARARNPEFFRYGPLDVTHDVCDQSVWLLQQTLLAEREDLDYIVEAVRRISAAWAS